MSEDAFPKDEMGYDALAQEALRGVVKAALQRAAAPEGLPGAHHLYITFMTGALGVSIPGEVRAKYPEDMTIVLQHQYWDLEPGDVFFSVKLKFGGHPKRLIIPYNAIVRFYDPSVQFMLQFETPAIPEPAIGTKAPVPDDTGNDAAAESAPKVVSLDQFRKK